MLDFIKICQTVKKGVIEISPKFKVGKTKDLMIRGGDFYAIYNEKSGLWSTDEFIAIEMIDLELEKYYKEHKDEFESKVRILYLWDSDSGTMDKWHKYCQKQMPDNYHPLDEKVVFLDTKTTRDDFASKRLPYPLVDGSIESYDKLMSVLYSPEERRKIEWAVGSIIAGDSKTIQKFLVLYGSAGTGKSTVLNIIQKMFDGYYSTFDAESLGSKSDSFALEPFSKNPLLAIQHDGDLSRIESNTRLNSIVSHEEMVVNQKFKSLYSARFNAILFMGTNRPVKITDAKSGILRRLIDVSPTGNKVEYATYNALVSKIDFELGAIAVHCMNVYKEDPHYYDKYVPVNMMGASNTFYDFILETSDIFEKQEYTLLQQAWTLYNQYCDSSNVGYPMTKIIFKEELKNYFKNYDEQKIIDGIHCRKVYSGFSMDKFTKKTPGSVEKIEREPKIKFEEQESILDDILSGQKAQYASEQEAPIMKWDNVTTKLKDIDTSRLHYVRVPKNHIVIDFDLKDKNGEKNFKKNLEAASKWPTTYAELSKSGKGIHLHYFYDGDVSMLSRLYDTDIEIKIFTGKSSLRRKLTKCNDQPIATINSGLPLKGEAKMINFDAVKSEKGLRSLIIKNLNKEIHGATKPSIDFIYKILEDAYNNGVKYDVSDMRAAIFEFAMGSSHQAKYCMDLVPKMKFKSEEVSKPMLYGNDQLIFFDVEVLPNLFVVVWKPLGKQAVRMINPSPIDIENLMKFKLIGFNCRRYDNHILYARFMGYSNEELYKVSKRIINGDKGAFFGEAYNISYTDIYDFSSKKQSLKKFEIELGIHHQELGLDWDTPVPEELWTTVADYCVNDVEATEAVFLARQSDWTARQILADIAGLTVNDTTNTLTTKIIFGDVKHPQSEFVYTDLSEMFPGYSFSNGKSSYRGEDPGEGGYVYAEPGMYRDVALLDVASMHPTSIEQLNLFGPYTENFSDIKKARIAIKHKEYDIAGKMFDGKLERYLGSDDQAEALAYALKIAINSVYGLTSAKFDNKCRDPRNIDNIVAKRGALFMINLKHEVQERGFTVAHIKTDSIKIPDATPEIIDFVMDYGKQYGYIFEHEATYRKMCLVNDAVYIAQYDNGKWTATGTQFQVPYIFKKLFSKEPIEFVDLCETKTVTSALYLDFNENLPEGEHGYRFVGKAGQFCPIKPGCGGGLLLREKSDGGYASATGAKGYRWMESEVVKTLNKEKDIDISYYERLADEAIVSISEYGDYEWFVAE